MRKRTEGSDPQGEAGQVTRSRLQKTAAHESTALSPGRRLCYRGFVVSLPAAERRQLCCRTPKLREQSENVYENKESRSRGVEQSRSSEAEPGSQAVGCRRYVTLQLWTLDFSTRTFTTEPGISMKTKERCGKLRGGPIVLSDRPMARSPDLLGTMAHFPESQVLQMPHCRALRPALL